eukprot:GEMP01021191.1.p1 GENE.GEMP01021191.1~~GEMP01021191.1.p1  ORF type:complete len:145 (-),score=9.18 GEMP01021191.1:1445-1879(-)
MTGCLCNMVSLRTGTGIFAAVDFCWNVCRARWMYTPWVTGATCWYFVGFLFAWPMVFTAGLGFFGVWWLKKRYIDIYMWSHIGALLLWCIIASVQWGQYGYYSDFIFWICNIGWVWWMAVVATNLKNELKRSAVSPGNSYGTLV